MYNHFQPFMPVDPTWTTRNQQLEHRDWQPSTIPPPLTSINPFASVSTMQHWPGAFLEAQRQATILHWQYEAIYRQSLACAASGPVCPPVYPSHWQGPGMDQHAQAHAGEYYYGAPSMDRLGSHGPSRKQRKRFHKAEPPYPNQSEHESSGTIREDRSIGVNPGMAWIGTGNKPGVRKVWRTPSKNPLIVDCDLLT